MKIWTNRGYTSTAMALWISEVSKSLPVLFYFLFLKDSRAISALLATVHGNSSSTPTISSVLLQSWIWLFLLIETYFFMFISTKFGSCGVYVFSISVTDSTTLFRHYMSPKGPSGSHVMNVSYDVRFKIILSLIFICSLLIKSQKTTEI